MEIRWNRHVVILYDKYRDERAAIALKAHIEREFSPCDVILIDSVSYNGVIFSKFKRASYKYWARHNRSFLHTASLKMDALDQKRVDAIIKYNGANQKERLLRKHEQKRILNIIKRFDPIMVICTTAEALRNALIARTSLGKSFRTIGSVTEFALDLSFVRSDADGFFVENPEVKQKLISCGIAPDRIAVVGYPTLGFDINADRIKKRTMLGLTGLLPLVVVNGGDYDTYTLKNDIIELMKNKDDYILMILTTDKKMRKYYMDLPDFSVGVLINESLTADILDVCDVLITIPESSAVFEAFMRGIGVIVAPAVTVLEKSVRKYLVKRALVIPSRTPQETVFAVREMLKEPDRRLEFKHRGEIYARMSLNDIRNLTPKIENEVVKKLSNKSN